MDYEIVKLETKTIVGITARTGNGDAGYKQVIGKLWADFMSDGLEASICNRASSFCVGLYSDYDLAKMEYDVTVGTAVLENGNPELSHKTIPAGRYARFEVKGDVVEDVSTAWDEIARTPLDRAFSADFEEYRGSENGVAEVDIYVALR